MPSANDSERSPGRNPGLERQLVCSSDAIPFPNSRRHPLRKVLELRASLPVNAGFWWSENSGAASSGSWIILLCTSGILNITQLVEQTTASHVGQKLRLVDGQTGRNRITSCLPTVRELIRFSVFWDRSERSGNLGLDFQRLPTAAPIAAPATTPIHIQMAIECVAAPIA